MAAFSESIGARKRWMVTRSMRSVIVGQLLELAGMKKKEDVTQELKPYRVERDDEDLQKIISGIEATLYPFEHSASSENLYCLTSGKAVSDPVKQDLIQCFQIGGTWCNQFQEECFADPGRFEKPIPRRKVKHFVTDAVKTKMTTKDIKIRELQGTRDLFGRLYFFLQLLSILILPRCLITR